MPPLRQRHITPFRRCHYYCRHIIAAAIIIGCRHYYAAMLRLFSLIIFDAAISFAISKISARYFRRHAATAIFAIDAAAIIIIAATAAAYSCRCHYFDAAAAIIIAIIDAIFDTPTGCRCHYAIRYFILLAPYADLIISQRRCPPLFDIAAAIFFR